MTSYVMVPVEATEALGYAKAAMDDMIGNGESHDANLWVKAALMVDEAIEKIAARPSVGEEVVDVLQALIDYECKVAALRGFSDCTCPIQSRNAERAYETGTCPHQRARAILATLTPTKGD